ncbi:MAG: Nif11 family protein [Oscillospiraceae bacterium]|nr:Nif11 family protein [Oscillospiraceae bacterium]
MMQKDPALAEEFRKCGNIQEFLKTAAEHGYNVSSEEIDALSDVNAAALSRMASFSFVNESDPDEISAEDLAKVAGGLSSSDFLRGGSEKMQ